MNRETARRIRSHARHVDAVMRRAPQAIGVSRVAFMSPGADLRGVGVLVTRPEHQAAHLCELIEAEGGRAVRFPVLEILEPRDGAALTAIIDRLDEFDLAVFISPNAVTKAMNRIAARRALPQTLRIAAVGKGSARELARFGITVDVVPARGFDSEGLLALDAMQRMSGKRVVIFRGEGGRELLADELRARGAEVEYAEVYRRARPQSDVGELMRHWARGEIDVAVVTSADGLRNLYDMVGKLGQQWLRKLPLVVVSERMVQLAQELGFKHPPIVAAEAADEAIVAAIEAWRRASASGDNA